ncbi:MAG: hypothetical protein B6U88_00495 [Candidatus Aenigmarchaeota archaeon ex4484_56]|nr:MAG: hypothetical protein B6U88_00495 [Candidatus Aenigmarchaeota archaeon ex4484_56]
MGEVFPFPHSRVKDILRSKLKEGTFIKKNAVIELNLWLGKIAEKIAEEVCKTDKAYISVEDIKKCIGKYEAIEKIEDEKNRISLHLNAIKEDINILLSDLNR